jgi:hypothetical protein
LELVETKYVCVVQHDRTFLRGPVPVGRIIAAMNASAAWSRSEIASYDSDTCNILPDIGTKVPWKETSSASDTGQVVNSVALLTRSNVNFLRRMSGRPSMRSLCVEAEKLVWTPSELQVDTGHGGVVGQLVPLLQFYDSTHFALTNWYRDFVFDPRKRLVSKHGFVEDLLSMKLLDMCRRRGLVEGHRHFGVYLYDDLRPSIEGDGGEERDARCAYGSGMVGHLDGGSFVTDDVRRQLRQSRLPGEHV